MKFLFNILFIAFLANGINSETFYSVFSGTDINEIDKQISVLEESKLSELHTIYLGALLTKKSNAQKDVKIKIATFKKGAGLIEETIESNPDNIEYRFIRYIIQENAPKILKYNSNLTEDKVFIESNFDKASIFIQKEIKKYSKISTSLKI